MKKDDLHKLVDDLRDADVPIVRRLLQALQPTPPLPRMLADAPVDDEPSSPGEEAAMKESLDAKARGEVHSAEEVRRLLLG